MLFKIKINVCILIALNTPLFASHIKKSSFLFLSNYFQLNSKIENTSPFVRILNWKSSIEINSNFLGVLDKLIADKSKIENREDIK